MEILAVDLPGERFFRLRRRSLLRGRLRYHASRKRNKKRNRDVDSGHGRTFLFAGRGFCGRFGARESGEAIAAECREGFPGCKITFTLFPGLKGECKMLRVVVVSAVLLPILGGCAVMDKKLANNKGQVAQCSGFGAGIVGTVVAVAATQNCVEKYKQQGFHEVPATAPAPAAPTKEHQASAKKKQTPAEPNPGN